MLDPTWSARVWEEDLLARVSTLMVETSKDWYSPVSEAQLHRIDRATADQQSAFLIGAVAQAWPPGTFQIGLLISMAGMAQESRFDSQAINPNGEPGNIGRTDWGIAQMSGGTVLSIAKAEGVGPSVVVARALDAEYAIPWMVKEYRRLILWAKKRFPTRDPFYLGAMAYNRGRTGMEIIVTLKPRPGIKNYETMWQVVQQAVVGHRHARKVMAWRRQFTQALGGI